MWALMEKSKPLSLQAYPVARGLPPSSEWVSAEPPSIGRDEQALDAEIAAFFPRFVVENTLAIVLDHVVVKLLAGKTTDRV